MTTDVIAAPYGRRVGAYLVDSLVVFAVLAAPMALYSGSATTALENQDFAAFFAAYGLVWGLALVVGLGYQSLKGTAAGTLGMRALKTRIIDVDTREPIGVKRAVGRALVWSLVAPYLGFVSPLFDKSGHLRGWHDKALNTRVIDARVITAPVVAPAEAESAAGTEYQERVVKVAIPGATPVSPLADAEASTPDPSEPSPPNDGDAPIDSVPGFSVPATPSEIPVSADAAGVDAPGVEDSDDELDQTRLVVASAPPPGATLNWDDGTVTHVAEAAVFGRNPSARDVTGAIEVAVRDTTRSLSKTHFALFVEAGSVWVEDASSTNGTEVHRVNGSVDVAPPAERVAVNDGDALVMGARTCRVTVVS